MAQLALGDRTYELVTTDSAYADGVVARSRCAILIDYAHLADAFAAPVDSLGQAWETTLDSNYERHVRAVCENGHVLSPMGLTQFLMAFGSEGMSMIGPDVQPECPACGVGSCYFFYDPDGFPESEIS